jgi:hypothetical protein
VIDGRDVVKGLMDSNFSDKTGHGSLLGPAVWCLVVIGMAVGCAIPGRLYLVAPAISGSVRGGEVADTGSALRLVVMHRESPSLHHRSELLVSPSGAFRFDPVEMVIAGHEYSKSYRVFLHLEADGKDRVIWRATMSRLEVVGPIELDCDLDRPPAHGQTCWVKDPAKQPWLVAEGRRTYVRLCSECHGIDGGGETSSAAPLIRTPPDLRRIAERRGGRFDHAEIAGWIEGRSVPASHGTRAMPIWGERLSERFERYAEGDELIAATLDPVLAYLESLQDANAPSQ